MAETCNRLPTGKSLKDPQLKPFTITDPGSVSCNSGALLFRSVRTGAMHGTGAVDVFKPEYIARALNRVRKDRELMVGIKISMHRFPICEMSYRLDGPMRANG